MFQYVPPELLPHLADLSPYILVVLKKGPRYHDDNAIEIIQSQHLPYVFKQREEGLVILTFRVMDDTELAAIAIYDTPSQHEVKEWMEEDPAVKANIFVYEIVSGVGMKGDALV
ncbi:MAG TPA: hypothetical protein PL009_14595 [Flavipsychrobacter sp.]|nr:hypothetical protein [Flavipsychrobacter sp.]